MIPKFRAYIKKSKKIYPVNDLTLNGIDDEPVGINGCGDSTCTTCLDWYRFEDIELMQSTGLKDKNGVVIFEGDIILFTIEDGFDYVYGEPGRINLSPEWGAGVRAIQGGNYSLRECREVKVIGNIYENPELLEVEG
ncbi:YopX family protein [Enterococcus avium]|uniref:YopX family protein n=1 Tax=Enterococcus avium TaxID=33945 RepID=UPI00288E509A|nr:YopX family protein [Enterococcus avium]MDT2422427.1 YopX family protein [Enterococcus avium]